MEQARKIADELDDSSLRAAVYLDHAFTLSNLDSEQALDALSEAWTLIQECVDAFRKMRAHVLRARLRLEVENDAQGAAEDAQKALDFYQERDVDSRWSREAEEILEKTQAHDTS